MDDIREQIQDLVTEICSAIGKEAFPYTINGTLKSQEKYKEFKETHPKYYARLRMALESHQRNQHCDSCTED